MRKPHFLIVFGLLVTFTNGDMTYFPTAQEYGYVRDGWFSYGMFGVFDGYNAKKPFFFCDKSIVKYAQWCNLREYREKRNEIKLIKPGVLVHYCTINYKK